MSKADGAPSSRVFSLTSFKLAVRLFLLFLGRQCTDNTFLISTSQHGDTWLICACFGLISAQTLSFCSRSYKYCDQTHRSTFTWQDFSVLCIKLTHRSVLRCAAWLEIHPSGMHVNATCKEGQWQREIRKKKKVTKQSETDRDGRKRERDIGADCGGSGETADSFSQAPFSFFAPLNTVWQGMAWHCVIMSIAWYCRSSGGTHGVISERGGRDTITEDDLHVRHCQGGFKGRASRFNYLLRRRCLERSQLKEMTLSAPK